MRPHGQISSAPQLHLSQTGTGICHRNRITAGVKFLLLIITAG